MAQQQNTRQNDAWKQVFGTLENVVSRQGRKGLFVTATVRGKGKGANNTFDIIAFGEKAELVLAAGTGADVWAKGPQEPVTRTNAAGREFQEMGPIKVVYFKDNSAEAEGGETADGEAEAPEAAGPDDLTAIKGIGGGFAEKLSAAGIDRFELLANATDEALDAISAGAAKRATAGDWRGQAAKLAEAATAAEDEDADIPF